MALPKFRLQIVSLRAMLFSGDVQGVFLASDEGEFELLAFHYPIMAALLPGDIRIAHDKNHVQTMPIKSGVVLFRDNLCTLIINETAATMKLKDPVEWSDLDLSEEKVLTKKPKAPDEEED